MCVTITHAESLITKFCSRLISITANFLVLQSLLSDFLRHCHIKVHSPRAVYFYTEDLIKPVVFHSGKCAAMSNWFFAPPCYFNRPKCCKMHSLLQASKHTRAQKFVDIGWLHFHMKRGKCTSVSFKLFCTTQRWIT